MSVGAECPSRLVINVHEDVGNPLRNPFIKSKQLSGPSPVSAATLGAAYPVVLLYEQHKRVDSEEYLGRKLSYPKLECQNETGELRK